jgi:hypothetical protein
MVAVDGGAQSVTSTGSHTTKTHMRRPENCFSMLSAAEAPCRQIGHVGESRSSSLTSFFEALKASLS